ncbi:MAG: flagellar filament capping protein FliD [Chitinispirillia bacterium]|nr:flagellar filament capping protein FliD [Chitinispirillia bacterium]
MDIGTQMRLTGLATGLDTDEVIRNMGRIHTLRIDAVNRERQLAVWRQELFRDTINMFSGFQRNYLNRASPTNNFLSASAFAKFSYNLSLGGDAAAASRIMSVTANGDLQNFNQSVQAVAQLATKDTWSGDKMDLQGITSDGFDIEKFGTRNTLTQSQKDALLAQNIDSALKEYFQYDDWVADNFAGGAAVWISSGGGEQWYNETFENRFEEFAKTAFNNDFQMWLELPGNELKTEDDWDEFWAGFKDGTDVVTAQNDFKNNAVNVSAMDQAAAVHFAGVVNNAWEDYLKFNSGDSSDAANLVEHQKIVDDTTADFGDGSTVTGFRYAFIGVSIDGVSRTIEISNTDLQKVYDENSDAEGWARGFADLINKSIASQFGRDFGTLAKAVEVDGKWELKIDKPGSNVAIFEESGFDSLQRMGFTSGASNRNFGGKNVGGLFPDLFGHAVDASSRPLYVTDSGVSVYRFVDNGEIQYRDKDGRQVFIGKDGRAIFRTSDDRLVDKDGKQMTNDDVQKPITSADVKPQVINSFTNIHINGKSITILAEDTVSQMVSKVNSADAGVTLAYDAANDRFTLTSAQDGSVNNINVTMGEVDKDGNVVLTSSGAFFAALKIIDYNKTGGDNGKGSIDYNDRKEGQNLRAVINGQEVVRFSNSFHMDGMTYNFHETFNSTIDDDGKIIITNSADEIKIQVTKNTEEIVDSIRTFVDEYNKLIDHINTLMYEKRNRDYPPLTDDQKKAMKEDEIKAWEDKAKSGLLSGDMELRRLLDSMRRSIYETVEGAGISMAEIGITTTSNYRDGGKLVIDESKLNAALEGKYDSVVRLFTKSSDIPYGSGNQAQRYRESGIANRLNDIISDAVRTTTVNGQKGYLVEKAGVPNDVTSVNNQFTKQINDYDRRIGVLLDRWKRQEQSYYQMFARMESAMMKLQTQQNNLASLMAQGG